MVIEFSFWVSKASTGLTLPAVIPLQFVPVDLRVLFITSHGNAIEQLREPDSPVWHDGRST